MKFFTLAAGIAALVGATSAGATVSVDLGDGRYTLTYDETTILGDTSSSFTSSDNSVGFSWNLPSDINIVSLGTVESQSFTLPDFTITAKAGYTLSGPITGFLGNLVYTEVNGATTSASATGDVAVNGIPMGSTGGNLDRVETLSFAGGSSGYYGSSTAVPAGSFNSFSVSNFILTLNASGGSFSSIVAQPQNKLEVTFFAVPVPEPETYAMLLAGLGLIAGMMKRRKQLAGSETQ